MDVEEERRTKGGVGGGQEDHRKLCERQNQEAAELYRVIEEKERLVQCQVSLWLPCQIAEVVAC